MNWVTDEDDFETVYLEPKGAELFTTLLAACVGQGFNFDLILYGGTEEEAICERWRMMNYLFEQGLLVALRDEGDKPQDVMNKAGVLMVIGLHNLKAAMAEMELEDD